MKLRNAIAALGVLSVMGSSLVFTAPAAQAADNSGYYYSSVSYHDRYDRRYDNRDHYRDRESYRNAIERQYRRALNELQRVRDDSRLPSNVRSQLINRYENIVNYLANQLNRHDYNW